MYSSGRLIKIYRSCIFNLIERVFRIVLKLFRFRAVDGRDHSNESKSNADNVAYPLHIIIIPLIRTLNVCKHSLPRQESHSHRDQVLVSYSQIYFPKLLNFLRFYLFYFCYVSRKLSTSAQTHY